MLNQVVHTITSSFRMGTGAPFRGLSEQGVAVTIHSHLGPKLGLLSYLFCPSVPAWHVTEGLLLHVLTTVNLP